MKLLIFYFFSMIMASTAEAQTAAFDQNHGLWSKVLTEYVVQSKQTTQVKYFELSKNENDLNLYLKGIEAVTKTQYSTWTEKQKLAFLFNSYNAFTIKLILTELKKDKNLKSIKKLGGLFSNAWKIKFFNFLGKESSLDGIEQDIARKDFDEPRMHFAFNCASIGCPALQNEAYTAEKLDHQLDLATRNFLKDQTRNELNKKNHTLSLSQIFRWYRDDFENSKKLGPLAKFILTYFPFTEEEKKEYASGKYDLKFLEYNWDLNGWKM